MSLVTALVILFVAAAAAAAGPGPRDPTQAPRQQPTTTVEPTPLYQASLVYGFSTSCAGGNYSFYSQRVASPVSVTCGARDPATASIYSMKTVPNTGYPQLPGSNGIQVIGVYQWLHDTGCGVFQTYPDIVTAFPLGQCYPIYPSGWARATCAPTGVASVEYFSDINCINTTTSPNAGPAAGIIPYGCTISANLQGSMRSSCPNVNATCIHRDSTVSYKGQATSMVDMQRGKNAECHVPHTVHADGVKLLTTCSAEPLRLSNDHLVFTPDGLVAAQTLVVGAVVYGDEAEQKLCTVKEITPEHGEIYMGLNCHESVVMASGVKISTFGRYHVIPSIWMKAMSSVLGVERASRLGDRLVTMLAHLGLY